MSSEKGRYTYAKRILKAELFSKLETSRILLVGAGGIGCELLKNVVTAGFKNIEIIDLDTIDLSNLNRQFLFSKQHVKRPKATVAKETAHNFNPDVSINALHANIKEARFNVAYFKQFDIVMNALDNMDARRHVNKMCMAADVPLIESGTAGYSGQTQPIKKDETECYDCSGKPVPKGFPVCTIRSTPSTPIHCIVWAKSFLFPQLFGAEEDETVAKEELEKAAAQGENATELAELGKETAAIKEIRSTMNEPGSAKRVFNKVFKQDIERLLIMEDMWKHRNKPTPLSYDELAEAAAKNPSSSTSHAAGTIKDQRQLSLQDSFELFNNSLKRLVARVVKKPDDPLEWDKDDDDALDFATAAANLRAHIFGIPSKTRFDVKQMAGNIIPAIATTNAIVAGLLVLQALKALANKWNSTKLVWVARTNEKAISTTNIAKPNPHCAVCRTPYVSLEVDASKLTLSTFVEEVVKDKVGFGGDVSLVEGSRLLFDPDFDDNAEKTFGELGLDAGTMLTVADEDGNSASVVFLLSQISPESQEAYNIPHAVPKIPEKPAPLPEEAPEPAADPTAIAGRKRKADEAELEGGQDSKKLKADANGVVTIEDDADDGVIDID